MTVETKCDVDVLCVDMVHQTCARRKEQETRAWRFESAARCGVWKLSGATVFVKCESSSWCVVVVCTAILKRTKSFSQ
eukprot:6591191-Lingulodinium_polyedra.AAC.1